jgi:hypothetical protein
MAFTRFHDDPCRIKKRLQESTDQGRYILDVPGNGSTPYYIDDPHLRLQKWGGNLMTDSINIENDLKGLTRSINQDCLLKNNYNSFLTNFAPSHMAFSFCLVAHRAVWLMPQSGAMASFSAGT